MEGGAVTKPKEYEMMGRIKVEMMGRIKVEMMGRIKVEMMGRIKVEMMGRIKVEMMGRIKVEMMGRIKVSNIFIFTECTHKYKPAILSRANGAAVGPRCSDPLSVQSEGWTGSHMDRTEAQRSGLRTGPDWTRPRPD